MCENFSQIRRYGDRAFLIQFKQSVDTEQGRKIRQFRRLLDDQKLDEVLAVHSAFASITVTFDPSLVSANVVEAWLAGEFEKFSGLQNNPTPSVTVPDLIEIPVCYDSEFALDREDLIKATGLEWDSIVRLHCEPVYEVMMSGFLPGFGYMAEVDPNIRFTRKSNPRLKVPRGSVGIADSLTGIYPLEAPGGWQILGRTPLSMFDEAGESFRLEVGDRVKFKSISRDDFETLENEKAQSETASRNKLSDSDDHLVLDFLMPGMQTTIQDLGRSGFESNGVPVSGAMDVSSATTANALVGNDKNAPVVEITLLGPVIQFSREASIAICGADLSPSLDGVPVSNNVVTDVPENGILRFGRRSLGCRAYLAVAGELQVTKWLGSASATFPFASQWTPGAVIRKGTRLRFANHLVSRLALWWGGNPTETRLPDTNGEDDVVSIRIWQGPEFKLFSEAQQRSLCDTTYHVSPSSNRMGYRLEPSLLAEPDNSEKVGSQDDNFGERNATPERLLWREGIVSSVVFPGVIQVPPSGEPIVLLRDCQTTGGYSRIAVVHSEDLDRMGQLAPGDELRFNWVDS